MDFNLQGITAPYDKLYGVDIALKKLRPEASYTLYGTSIQEYKDPSGLPMPTWDEIASQLEKDKKDFEEWAREYSVEARNQKEQSNNIENGT
jgi:hypothetical protein